MRVLVLTHRLPYAPDRGDRLRAYHVLQHLRTRAEVELVSLVHDDEGGDGSRGRAGLECPEGRGLAPIQPGHRRAAARGEIAPLP